MPGFFFLIRNQAFRYGPSKSSKTPLSRRSCTIFITSETNAWGNRKFGACHILCGIVFKTTREEISSWNRLHLGYLKEITLSRLSIISLNNTLFFGRSISPTSRLASLFEISRVPQGIAENRGKSKCWYSPIYCCKVFRAFERLY